MKRQVKWQPHEIVLMLLSLAAGVFLWIAPEVWGATKTTFENFGNPETDTVIVVRRNMATSALIDSTMRLAADSSFPHYVELTWDDGIDYSMFVLNHFSEGWFPDVPFEWKKFTGASASIDYEEMGDTIRAIISGDGPFNISFYTIDSSNSNAPIPNANVTIRNQAQTAMLAKTLNGTDANGLFVAGLDTGITVKAITTLSGYIFTPANDIFRIDSVEVDTIFGYAFTPSAPSGDSTCTVYGWIYDNPTTTTAERFRVTFTSAGDVYDVCNGRALGELTAKCWTTSTGYFEVELLFSSCLALRGSTTSDTIKYDMNIGGWTATRSVTVPDSATYRITWQ